LICEKENRDNFVSLKMSLLLWVVLLVLEHLVHFECRIAWSQAVKVSAQIVLFEIQMTFCIISELIVGGCLRATTERLLEIKIKKIKIKKNFE